jgi:hypothetical protein
VLRRLPFVVGLLAVLAAALAVSVAAGPRDDPWTIFTDPAGDSKGALDLTKVALKHSDTEGTFTFEITAPKPVALLRAPDATPPPRPTITTHFLSLCLDTDRNAGTGSGSYGCEYTITYHGGGLDVMSWDGTKMQPAPFKPVASFNGLALWTWTIKRSDVGNPTGLAFRLTASAIVDAPTGITQLGPDAAPDSGAWNYDLVARPPAPATTAPAPVIRPVISPPTTTPAQPIAGKRLTVSFRVTRSDTGARLSSGTMVCDPSVAGTVLQHAESLTGGTARLTFTLPRNSKGKLLRVKLTVRAGAESATRVATLRIR